MLELDRLVVELILLRAAYRLHIVVHCSTFFLLLLVLSVGRVDRGQRDARAWLVPRLRWVLIQPVLDLQVKWTYL